jgi:hypothetical protein
MGIATAYNPRNYQNYQIQRKNEIMNYYRQVSPNAEQSSTPITLSWNLNAYVEEKKEGLVSRCCKRFKRQDKINDAEANQQINGYYAPVPNNNEPKRILKDGKYFNNIFLSLLK